MGVLILGVTAYTWLSARLGHIYITAMVSKGLRNLPTGHFNPYLEALMRGRQRSWRLIICTLKAIRLRLWNTQGSRFEFQFDPYLSLFPCFVRSDTTHNSFSQGLSLGQNVGQFQEKTRSHPLGKWVVITDSNMKLPRAINEGKRGSWGDANHLTGMQHIWVESGPVCTTSEHKEMEV